MTPLGIHEFSEYKLVIYSLLSEAENTCLGTLANALGLWPFGTKEGFGIRLHEYLE